MISIAYVLLAAAASTSPQVNRVQFAQLTIRQRIVIRVPALARPLVGYWRSPPNIWQEKRGPRCLTMATLAGASLMQADSVDLFMRGGGRIRARLNNACPALDFYSGFYLAPTGDGQVCAGRDMIRTRNGAECAIERFRTLVQKR